MCLKGREGHEIKERIVWGEQRALSKTFKRTFKEIYLSAEEKRTKSPGPGIIVKLPGARNANTQRESFMDGLVRLHLQPGIGKVTFQAQAEKIAS